MEDVKRLARAYDFAAKKHRDQRRKGKGDEPYINHPASIANILAQAEASIDTIIAGILHDTVEDTETTYEELIVEFGQKIADIVMEVTDDKNLPKAERKQSQIDKMAGKSIAAKKVKIADKVDNFHAIIRTPPDWSLERKIAYYEWGYKVVANGRGTCDILEKQFDEVYERGLEILKDQEK